MLLFLKAISNCCTATTLTTTYLHKCLGSAWFEVWQRKSVRLRMGGDHFILQPPWSKPLHPITEITVGSQSVWIPHSFRSKDTQYFSSGLSWKKKKKVWEPLVYGYIKWTWPLSSALLHQVLTWLLFSHRTSIWCSNGRVSSRLIWYYSRTMSGLTR